MFGGKLFYHHIEIIQNKNCLLAVNNNYLYCFDRSEKFILTQIKLSQNLIKAWSWMDNQTKIVAVDEDGHFVEVIFEDFNKKNQIWYKNTKITSKKITKSISNANIIINQDNLSVFFIQDNDLYEYIKGTKNLFSKNINKLLFSSSTHIICSPGQNKKSIKIINLQNKQQTTFNHSSQITSAIAEGNTLIIGDIRGKIYIYRNYHSSSLYGKQNNHNSLATKLEWHVHQVNGLFLQGEYLYSCGEQGTVVMWHLRQNKKDFLPRIGTEINNVFVKQGVVYCLLNDNTITSIDLNNDKLVKNYKTIINPFGFVTKNIKHNGFDGKRILFKHTELNNRNLIISSGLSGSLQMINLNDGLNHQIQIIPRNLISRLDQYYPEPHDIQDVALNKQWTLMCCSTYGVNHNYLHFYKNQGYNLQYNLISKVENPHQGSISILSYKNMFVTYAIQEKTIRFWSKVSKNKKSIIQKQQEYFTCSGEINYRGKSIKNCSINIEDNLLLVNYEDQIIIIDLQQRSIKMAFKVRGIIEQALFIKVNKNTLKLLIVTDQKISVYDLNKETKQLKNQKVIYTFESIGKKNVQVSLSNAKVGVLIRYLQKQVVLEYDLTKTSVLSSFQNEKTSQVSILSICYQNAHLLAFSSDSSLINLTNTDQIIKFSAKQSFDNIHLMQSEQRTDIQESNFENLHKNFIQRANIRNKVQLIDCLQKIQLEMYPSFGFGFNALCQKMFY